MIRIKFSSHFTRAMKKCSEEILRLLDEDMALFLENPRDVRLHIKPLSGALKGFWSFRVGRNHRVLYRQLSSTVFLFYDIDDRKDIYSY